MCFLHVLPASCRLHVLSVCTSCMCFLHVLPACASCMGFLHALPACASCMCFLQFCPLSFHKANLPLDHDWKTFETLRKLNENAELNECYFKFRNEERKKVSSDFTSATMGFRFILSVFLSLSPSLFFELSLAICPCLSGYLGFSLPVSA